MNITFRHHAYKVELKPTPAQRNTIERTICVCRYVYNLFIATNRDNYSQGKTSYMNGYDFSKWLNHEYRAANPDKLWIWEVSSKAVKKKAVKKAIMNADTACKNFMKGRAGFPKFKRRNGRPVSMYLPRNNTGDLTKGQALSVTITRRAGRYFAAFVFESAKAEAVIAEKSSGIGIDLGVKSFAVISDGRNFPNLNHTRRMRKLTKRLKHEQRKFMRKLRHRKEDAATKKCNRSNLDTQRLKVQRAYMRLTNKRHDYINKNRQLSLSRCGHVKKDLQLSERVYICRSVVQLWTEIITPL